MEYRHTRTELLLGPEGLSKLSGSRVLVFGAGGVGGYVIEALARTGIGTIGVCDMDTVSGSNLNRQLLATEQTVGMSKVQAAEERIRAVDSSLRTVCYPFPLDGSASWEQVARQFGLADWDYIVDAIDDVQAKVLLAKACKNAVGPRHPEGVPLIMSMGTGNKLDPAQLQVADLAKTHTCPLAKAVRTALRKEGIDHVKCVFSTEPPRQTGQPVGTCVFVPAAAGLLLASQVVRDLLSL